MRRFLILGVVCMMSIGSIFLYNSFSNTKRFNQLNSHEVNIGQENYVDSEEYIPFRLLGYGNNKSYSVVNNETWDHYKIYYNGDCSVYLGVKEPISFLEKNISISDTEALDQVEFSKNRISVNLDYEKNRNSFQLYFNKVTIDFIKIGKLNCHVSLIDGDKQLEYGDFYYLTPTNQEFLFEFSTDLQDIDESITIPAVNKKIIEDQIKSNFEDQVTMSFHWIDDYKLKVTYNDFEIGKYEIDDFGFEDEYGTSIESSPLTFFIDHEPHLYGLGLERWKIRDIPIDFEGARLWRKPILVNNSVIRFTNDKRSGNNLEKNPRLYYDMLAKGTISIEESIRKQRDVADYPFKTLYEKDIFFVSSHERGYGYRWLDGGSIHEMDGMELFFDDGLQGFKKLDDEKIIIFFRTWGGTSGYSSKIELVVYDYLSDEYYVIRMDAYYSATDQDDYLPEVCLGTTRDEIYVMPYSASLYHVNYKEGVYKSILTDAKNGFKLGDGYVIEKNRNSYKLINLLDDYKKEDIRFLPVNIDPRDIMFYNDRLIWTEDKKILSLDLHNQLLREIALDSEVTLMDIKGGTLYFYSDKK